MEERTGINPLFAFTPHTVRSLLSREKLTRLEITFNREFGLKLRSNWLQASFNDIFSLRRIDGGPSTFALWRFLHLDRKSLFILAPPSLRRWGRKEVLPSPTPARHPSASFNAFFPKRTSQTIEAKVFPRVASLYIRGTEKNTRYPADSTPPNRIHNSYILQRS